MLRVVGWRNQAGVEVAGAVCAEDSEMAGVLLAAVRLATKAAPILVTGESGVGKERVAAVLHSASRRSGRLVAVNCGALPQHTAESEIFGHERGAFTGAAERRAGAVEQANRGTLFLDEIGELPLEHQPKLLRVLETQRVRRLGGVEDHWVDFRLVCATHCDLPEMVHERRFRADLMYRLDVVSLHVPPLRDRAEDLLVLGPRLLKATGYRGDITEGAIDALLDHRWPGNVRELRNVLTRVSLVADDLIQTHHVLEAMAPRGLRATHFVPPALLRSRAHSMAEEALAATGGHIGLAARELGMSRSTLYRWVTKGWVPRQHARAFARARRGESRLRQDRESSSSSTESAMRAAITAGTALPI
ncbi:MAG: DNA-binding NtrC family response regulator [Myxococcota bacterium]|jgi:DNA-binding NtrC family response regulator